MVDEQQYKKIMALIFSGWAYGLSGTSFEIRRWKDK
jgi:hypothetical protein